MAGYEEILELCASGNNGGYMAFYEMFAAGVYNSSIRILRTAEDAEEVMQETLLKAMLDEKLHRKDRSQMEKLLRRIAINRSIDIYRKRRVRFVEFDSIGERSKELSEKHQSDIDDKFELTPSMVTKAMEQLAEGYRLILNLHLIEEMDYKEIAKALNMKESAVRSQYSRGRKRLAEKIKELYSYE